MHEDVERNHPIRAYFAQALHESLHERLGITEEDVEQYLQDMLLEFIHSDGIFSIRDPFGQRVEYVADMMAEGDVRLNADSFERERQVHKHIGDFVLFWSGVFPEFLLHLKNPFGKDAIVDYTKQGKLSYHVVSTFEYPPYDEEAPVFKKLSEGFEEFREALTLVRASFNGFAMQGWPNGFEA